jgi:hypothetical protein
MYATAQNLLRWKVKLVTLKFCAKAIVRRVSMRADQGPVDCIDGFLDWMTRGRKCTK